MKTVIHDFSDSVFGELYPNLGADVQVISQARNIHSCAGCFGCWVRTPGRCVIHDGYETLGKTFAQSEEVVIVSRVCYGDLSPFVKNVIDRSIGYLLPYFTLRQREMHHTVRNPHRWSMSVLGYGDDLTEREKDTFRRILQANAINWNIAETSVDFAERIEDIRRLRRTL